MIERIWMVIKSFLLDHSQHAWLEHLLLYLFIAGLIVATILLIEWYIKLNKDIKQMDKAKRKRDKQILKFISKKDNKTY